jgi:protein associated with RNAse G/E
MIKIVKYEGYKTFGDLKIGDKIYVLTPHFVKNIAVGELSEKPAITRAGLTLIVNHGEHVCYFEKINNFDMSIIIDEEGHIFGTSKDVIKEYYTKELEKTIKYAKYDLEQLKTI